MILVLGATGKIGRYLVPALLDAGAAVRAVTRDPARARIDARAEIAAADLGHDGVLPRLVDGVERVFLLTSGHGSDLVAQETAVATAAAEAGVSHLVKLSTTGVHFGQTDPITRAHVRAEAAIRAAGPAWTILRPGAFAANRFAWLRSIREEDTVYAAENDPPSALIHPRDVADVATLVLTTSGHEGEIYPLTGGEALTTEEQVHILADAVGRPLKYVAEAEPQARARMLALGWPASAIDGAFALKRESAGREHIVFGTVERLLGRPPRTFADWAAEHAEMFVRPAR